MHLVSHKQQTNKQKQNTQTSVSQTDPCWCHTHSAHSATIQHRSGDEALLQSFLFFQKKEKEKH
jgi:hypothetical protein